MLRRIFLSLFLITVLLSCEKKEQANTTLTDSLSFTSLDKTVTNVKFSNTIADVPQLNYYNFPYMYNGAGVAVGDINNDGLQDVYFVGNMVNNALYLNKGNFQFEDITNKAKVSGRENLRWSNGVTMVDINNDGWLDIYICSSGPFKTRRNLLYINNGDLTFTEKAQAFGLDDNGYSTQSVFFDYDRDGDLDVYIGTYVPTALEATNEYYVEKLKTPLEDEKDKLYRNDGNNHFTDVTEEAGVTNFGLTLNLSVSDFNNDGWLDIYVSNDFNSPDFMYYNNGNGTFTNKLNTTVNHTANFGMGTDAADINNDGFIDLVQLDMGSDNNKERKTNMSGMAPEKFYDAVNKGLHHQYMKNNLQLNNGNGTFSEIGELAGIAYTNWSWAALLCDLNNDGWKDLFISNGIRRNVNHNDFNNYDRLLQQKGVLHADNRHLILDKMPIKKHDNYVFVNKGDLTFEKGNKDWGLSYEGYTQGSAYVDLDNDGDLDMVTNNLNDVASIFRNNAIDSFPNNNFLKIKLKGTSDNYFGVGTKVKIVKGKTKIYQEMLPTRGYLSSVEPILHFGLGNIKKIDTLEVIWPNGLKQYELDISTNKLIEVVQNKTDSTELIAEKQILKTQKTIFTNKTKISQINYMHQENSYNDYEKEILLPHRMSQHGPALSVGDINGDKLDDFYIGGAKGFSGQFFLQNPDATFSKHFSEVIKNDSHHEDVASLLFDADNDGDLDIYIVSGGNEEPKDSKYYQDRLYTNDGTGNFERVLTNFPEILVSGAKVKAADYDHDGDLDLFIAGRQIPGKYPYPTSSYLLQNNSKNDVVSFVDVTNEKAAMLKEIGMVTDMVWTDFNGDNKVDIITVGEWMPIKLLKNNGNIFEDVTTNYGFENQTGWWYSVITEDMDNDGDQDIIAGNLGLNYKYKASKKEPFEVYSKDFDENGKNDIVLSYYEEGNLFPLRGRQCSSDQMPYIKKKFKNYEAFSNATIIDVLGQNKIESSLHYQANTFATTYYRNDGDTFTAMPLNIEAQISSVNCIYTEDFNKDGLKDIVLAGNLYESEVETPRNDASFGVFLKNEGANKFSDVSPITSGLMLRGETRGLKHIELADGNSAFIAVKNEGEIQLYSY
ncbi:VCBS repeat-containing protein [Wocania ichthyoenteri]|uniref:VCBS repeat-containing protein n=1 Tax=Wocania ichthyoenteri TaxID=1230531 RepID=UPI00053CF7BE|nr:VCBS repeat-containing protein [Wocania ichthyoenteri]